MTTRSSISHFRTAFACAAIALFAAASFTPVPVLARPVLAQDDGSVASRTDFPLVGETNAERVNLRTGPSTDYRILRKLEPTEKVVVVGEQGEWFEVRVPSGFPCYVLDSLLDRTNPDAVTVRDRRVNLRPTPSTQYFPAGQVTRGDKLIVASIVEGSGANGRTESWARVIAPSHVTAWVTKKYITILGPEKEFEREIVDLSANARKSYLETSVAPENAAAAAIRIELDKKFQQAELDYVDQYGADHPDFSTCRPLYEEIAAQEVAPQLADKARIRLESIDRESQRAEALLEVQKIQTDLEKKLEEAEREFEEATKPEPEQSGTDEPQDERIIGWVVKNLMINPFDQAEPAVKLVKGGKTLLLLSSFKYDLRDYIDRQVVIDGDTTMPEGLDTPLMTVRKIEILSER